MHSLRTILDAIFYILRTGCPGVTSLPTSLLANFPPWQTVFYHFRRFRLQCTWHLFYMALHRAERERRVGCHPSRVRPLWTARA
jgi:transposase